MRPSVGAHMRQSFSLIRELGSRREILTWEYSGVCWRWHVPFKPLHFSPSLLALCLDLQGEKKCQPAKSIFHLHSSLFERPSKLNKKIKGERQRLVQFPALIP